MKPVARIMLLACVCLLAACEALQPPKPYAGETQGTLALPYDAAWTRAVAFFAENRIPISVIDKNSGIIASNDLLVMEGGQNLTREKYVNCDSRVILAVDKSYTANISVLLQPVGEASTSFNLNVSGRVTYKDNTDGTKRKPETGPCVSSGRFEKAFLQSLRQ